MNFESASLLLFALTRHDITVVDINLLNNFSDFLNEFTSKHVKKDYLKNPNYLIQIIYNPRTTFNKDTELNAYYKASLFLANHSLIEILNNIRNPTNIKNKRESSIQDFKNQISDLIFDLKPIIEYIQKKEEKNFILFKGIKSYDQISQVIFTTAKNLYWQASLNEIDIPYRSSINLSIFALRQSLEIRFKRIIGIYSIKNERGENIKIRHDYIPNFLQENSELLELNNISISNVMKIYKWTNFCIHTGSMPRIWEAQFAIEFCMQFSWPSENPSSTYWSIFDSIKVKELELLRKRFSQKLNNDFTDDIWTITYQKPEANVIS